MQQVILAIIQGVTEFLPVSSSAHLVLLPALMDWEDQGLAIDVAAHAGSLFALLVCFRKEWIGHLREMRRAGSWLDMRSLHVLVLLGSVPVLLVGFFARDWVAAHLRNPLVIAGATILFALLLWWADRRKNTRGLADLGMSDAWWIGCAQIMALVPGASRAGVTMSAALYLGFSRQAAVRFAFALAVPVILAASGHEFVQLWRSDTPIELRQFCWVALLSFGSAWLAIRLFLGWLDRIGLLPFVLYRLLLGLWLFWMFL